MYYASVSSYIKDSIFDNKLEKWAKAAVCNQSNNKQVEKAIWFYFLWLFVSLLLLFVYLDYYY